MVLSDHFMYMCSLNPHRRRSGTYCSHVTREEAEAQKRRSDFLKVAQPRVVELEPEPGRLL